MFLNRNKKNNVYPCKPRFYYIKVGLKGSKLYRRVFVMIYVAFVLSLFVPNLFFFRYLWAMLRDRGISWVCSLICLFFFYIFAVWLSCTKITTEDVRRQTGKSEMSLVHTMTSSPWSRNTNSAVTSHFPLVVQSQFYKAQLKVQEEGKDRNKRCEDRVSRAPVLTFSCCNSASLTVCLSQLTHKSRHVR